MDTQLVVLRLCLDRRLRRALLLYETAVILVLTLISCYLAVRLKTIWPVVPILCAAFFEALSFARDPSDIVLTPDKLILSWGGGQPIRTIPLSTVQDVSFGFGSSYHSRPIFILAGGKRWRLRLVFTKLFCANYAVVENRSLEVFTVDERPANHVDSFVRVLSRYLPDPLGIRLRERVQSTLPQ